MKNIKIVLSSGCFPWMSLGKVCSLAQKTGYGGIELLPSRKMSNELKRPSTKPLLKKINGLHQNWRLDIGLDKSYGIQFPLSALFTILRLVLFPETKTSNETLKLLSAELNLPVTVHNLSEKWTKDNDKKEFKGGILLEIIGTSINPREIKNWIRQKKHNITLDSRDDQSLIWARKYGFITWQIFWKWLGVKKIKNYQLTFMGTDSLRKIMRHEKSLAEDQLLWLNKNKWEGHVTIELNPLVLFFLFKGDLEKGLKAINQFVKRTLILGKKWSG